MQLPRDALSRTTDADRPKRERREALDIACRPNVFILSDVRLSREGLAWCLSQRAEISLAGAAAPSRFVLAELAKSNVAALLFDATMQNGVDIVKELKRDAPEINVIAISVNESDDELLAYAEAGVAGYVTRDGSIDDLIDAVCRSLRGEIVCSPRLAARLFGRVAALSATKRSGAEAPLLTSRELEIVGLVDEGLSNKEIARTLRIGSATVKNHIHNVLEKLQVHRRGEAAAWFRHYNGSGALLGRVRADARRPLAVNVRERGTRGRSGAANY